MGIELFPKHLKGTFILRIKESYWPLNSAVLKFNNEKRCFKSIRHAKTTYKSFVQLSMKNIKYSGAITFVMLNSRIELLILLPCITFKQLLRLGTMQNEL